MCALQAPDAAVPPTLLPSQLPIAAPAAIAIAPVPQPTATVARLPSPAFDAPSISKTPAALLFTVSFAAIPLQKDAAVQSALQAAVASAASVPVTTAAVVLGPGVYRIVAVFPHSDQVQIAGIQNPHCLYLWIWQAIGCHNDCCALWQQHMQRSGSLLVIPT